MKERKIIRTVPLNEDQLMRAKQAFKFDEAVNDILTELITQLAKAKTREREMLWDSLDQLTNRDRTTETLSIDWVNRCVNVLKLEKDEDYV